VCPRLCKGLLHQVQRLPAWEVEVEVCGVQWLSSCEEGLRMPDLFTVCPREDEVAMCEVQRLPAWEDQEGLYFVCWLPSWPCAQKLFVVQELRQDIVGILVLSVRHPCCDSCRSLEDLKNQSSTRMTRCFLTELEDLPESPTEHVR
jgi:hypothetical protein